MKQLLIIRHAKSSWAVAGQDDFDRPLNERGMRDAPVMAQRLIDKGLQIDAFIASPAKRALTTANLFVETFAAPGKLKTMQKLYHAAPPVFYETIAAIDDGVETAAVFSHNPGITAFVNELTATRIDDMPTCAVFAVQVAIDHWKDFKQAQKTVWFFDYPKS
ncbi:histidine phosphatase family protein [Sediminibacterium roseum]|uniref:Histidine phosphatase family protein n=1 Tax=Sediminibacterium roseum TaxID=1978412 RepID=A0ABW9ZXQ9_9BACT|nr:histidine phosphatase family protein [Sediminibacterium roseum]NCI51946.1 histidine phosphatase family protein [Sediminibacterium roseum]